MKVAVLSREACCILGLGRMGEVQEEVEGEPGQACSMPKGNLWRCTTALLLLAMSWAQMGTWGIGDTLYPYACHKACRPCNRMPGIAERYVRDTRHDMIWRSMTFIL